MLARTTVFVQLFVRTNIPLYVQVVRTKLIKTCGHGKQYTCTIVRTRENLYVQQDGSQRRSKVITGLLFKKLQPLKWMFCAK